jgi:AcrR family transcriptional regulator
LSSAVSTTPRKSDRKLQHILRHAAEVFAEKGFEGASIRDISRASRVSLSGLYYYFESKQKLLYLIQYHAFSSILEQLEARLDGVAGPEQRLAVLIKNHLDYFLRHPLEMKVLSHESEALEEPYHRQVAAIKRRYYELALGLFEKLARAGSARRISPRIAVLSLFGMINWIYTWHNPKVDPQAEELAGAIAEMFLNGVMNGHASGGATGASPAVNGKGVASSRAAAPRRSAAECAAPVSRLAEPSRRTKLSGAFPAGKSGGFQTRKDGGR